jgi:hypothetical protein
MRTDLAQYYNSTSPSLRLQYTTSMDEKVNFEMNGTDLLMRELNIFISTKVNQRHLMEQIRQLALSNNTAGASIYDLGNIMKADSLAEITHVMKDMEQKTDAIRREQTDAQKQQVEMTQRAETERQEAKLRFEAEQNALDRQNEVQVAEIRASVNTALSDQDGNQQSDYIDTLEYLDKKHASDRDHAFKREATIMAQSNTEKDRELKRKEIETKERIADKQIQVARTNKNKYDK